MEMGSDRAGGHPQSFRYLAMFPAFQIVQQHDLALKGRKEAHCGTQPSAKVRTLCFPIGTGKRTRRVERDRLAFPELFTSEQVPGPILHDRGKPSREAIRIPAFLQPFKCNHERLLGDILGVLVPTRHSECHKVCRPLVAANQFGESPGVAGDRAANQDSIQNRPCFRSRHRTRVPC